MTARDVLAVRMAHAHNKAIEALEELGVEGSEERLQRIKESSRVSANHPVELASFQAEVIAALAEAVEDLASRVPAKKSAKGKAS